MPICASDCVVSETQEENDYALNQMAKVLKADIRPSTELNLEEMKRAGKTSVPS